MSEKSEHIIRREHFVSGWESGNDAAVERIVELLKAKAEELHSSHILSNNDAHTTEQVIWGLIARIKEENK